MSRFLGTGINGAPIIETWDLHDFVDVESILTRGGKRYIDENPLGQYWALTFDTLPWNEGVSPDASRTTKSPREQVAHRRQFATGTFAMQMPQLHGAYVKPSAVTIATAGTAAQLATTVNLRRTLGTGTQNVTAGTFVRFGGSTKVYMVVADVAVTATTPGVPASIYPALRTALAAGTATDWTPDLTVRYVPEDDRVIRHTNGSRLGVRVRVEEAI